MIFVIAYLILDSIVKNECMKKFTLLFALLKAMGVSAKAQQFSKWPVTPRVGVNISNVVRGKAPGDPVLSLSIWEQKKFWQLLQ